MNINFEDYLSDSEMQDIIREEFRNIARQKAKDDFERILSNIAYNMVWDAVEECFDENAKEYLKEKVKSIISNMTDFEVFRTPNAWGRPANSPYETLCNAVKENKELLDEKVKESIANLTKKDMKKVAMLMLENNHKGF